MKSRVFLSDIISTSNHMFGRVIWDILPKWIFLKILKLPKENNGKFKIFKNRKVIYPKKGDYKITLLMVQCRQLQQIV